MILIHVNILFASILYAVRVSLRDRSVECCGIALTKYLAEIEDCTARVLSSYFSGNVDFSNSRLLYAVLIGIITFSRIGSQITKRAPLAGPFGERLTSRKAAETRRIGVIKTDAAGMAWNVTR